METIGANSTMVNIVDSQIDNVLVPKKKRHNKMVVGIVDLDLRQHGSPTDNSLEDATWTISGLENSNELVSDGKANLIPSMEI